MHVSYILPELVWVEKTTILWSCLMHPAKKFWATHKYTYSCMDKINTWLSTWALRAKCHKVPHLGLECVICMGDSRCPTVLHGDNNHKRWRHFLTHHVSVATLFHHKFHHRTTDRPTQIKTLSRESRVKASLKHQQSTSLYDYDLLAMVCRWHTHVVGCHLYTLQANFYSSMFWVWGMSQVS
jgi:hypothetical protein